MVVCVEFGEREKVGESVRLLFPRVAMDNPSLSEDCPPVPRKRSKLPKIIMLEDVDDIGNILDRATKLSEESCISLINKT